MTHANTLLKIEMFSDGEDSPFLIRSRREIQLILNRIADEKARVALYYDDGNSFILTTLLAVDKQGLWLDYGPKTVDNSHIAHSRKVIFISSQRHVKVQFTSSQIKRVIFEDSEAFSLPLPDELLRLQRREYFRLLAPVAQPLKCRIPVVRALPDPAQHVTIMDISVGGVALVCEEYDTELQPGEIYPDCRIILPDFGTLIAAIQVQNTFKITLRNGAINKRAGCKFMRLDGAMSALLQRYITWLQSEHTS